MKRFIWGLILIALGVLSIAGSVQDPGLNPVGGLVIIIVGAILTYYGREYTQQGKRIMEAAITMMQDNGKIDSNELCVRSRSSQVDVRAHLVEAQRKGIIPFKIDIV